MDEYEFELPMIPLVGNAKDSALPLPGEYNYWNALKNRTLYLDFEIDDDYALMEMSKVIIHLNIMEKDIPKDQLKPIYIWIMSYGGDLAQSLFFCDLIESSRIPIITIGMGVAMSAGFLIFLAGKKRYAFKHSRMLVHSGSAGFQGTAEQIAEAQKDYKKQINEMKEYILTKTSIPETVFSKNKSKDWYLTANELEKYEIVDKIIYDIGDIING